jgi:hypothetical protein
VHAGSEGVRRGPTTLFNLAGTDLSSAMLRKFCVEMVSTSEVDIIALDRLTNEKWFLADSQSAFNRQMFWLPAAIGRTSVPAS